MIPFSSTQNGDREVIDLAFSKKKADDRKEWLRQFRVRVSSRVRPVRVRVSSPVNFANRHFSQPRHRQDLVLGFHQQGIDTLLDGRQCPLGPIDGGRPEAWSGKSDLGVV
jgi:hypothetical protein